MDLNFLFKFLNLGGWIMGVLGYIAFNKVWCSVVPRMPLALLTWTIFIL